MNWINSHGAGLIIAYFVFNIVVGSMPPLPADAGFWTKWIYGIFHTASGNIQVLMAAFPQFKAFVSGIKGTNGTGSGSEGRVKGRLMLAMACLAVFVLAFTPACSRYVVHPGAINTFDSQTADVLLQAKTLLDSSRPVLSPKTQPAWIALAKSYDTALSAYQAWRTLAKASNTPVDATELAKDLASLTKAINAFKNLATVPIGRFIVGAAQSGPAEFYYSEISFMTGGTNNESI